MRTLSYRLLHVGSTLAVWRFDESNRGTLIAHEKNVCGEGHCDDYDCEECRKSCDDAVNRLSIAAEIDYGTWLPWIAGDETTPVVVHTGPLPVPVSA